VDEEDSQGMFEDYKEINTFGKTDNDSLNPSGLNGQLATL